jgi:hypothetical protein
VRRGAVNERKLSTRVYPNVSGLSRNEIYAYNNKHSLRSNTKSYGGKSHQTDSQNSDTTAPSGRELYHLQFSFQAASPETFGYTLLGLLLPAYSQLLVGCRKIVSDTKYLILTTIVALQICQSRATLAPFGYEIL